MAKKKCKVLSVVLVLVMLIGLVAACGNGGEAAEGEVVIGVLAPMTGHVAHFGVAVNQGIELYVEQFNARGGTQIRLELFDEQGDAALGVTGYHELVDRGVTAIIGAVTSGVTIPVVPLAYADNMPMITATSTHLNVTVDADTGQVFTNMFRSCFIDPFQGYVMANFAFHEVGAQTAAVLYNNEIDYSVGLMQTFIAQAEALGLEVVAVEVFQTGAVDFNAQLANITAQNPDVLFVPEYFQAVSLIGQQALDAGLDATLLGADGWAAVVEFMDDASPLNGAFFLSGFYPGLPEPRVQQFVSEFYDKTGTQPDMFAAQAYDAAMILFAAIERALADGHEPNTDEFKTSVIAHMAATDLTGVTGHITFDQYNNPQKSAVVLHIQDGEEVFWGYF